MNREQAIDAGARALWDGLRDELADPFPWESISDLEQGRWRRRAAAVLDAVEWVDPDCDHVPACQCRGRVKSCGRYVMPTRRRHPPGGQR